MSKLKYKDSNGVWQSIAPSQKEFDDFKTSTNSSLADIANQDYFTESKRHYYSQIDYAMRNASSMDNQLKSYNIALLGDSLFGYLNIPLMEYIRNNYGVNGLGFDKFGAYGNLGRSYGHLTTTSSANITIVQDSENNVDEWGFCGRVHKFGTTSTFSYTPDDYYPFNDFRIFYLKRNGGGQFQYRIDGGTWVTVDTSNAPNALGYVEVNNLAIPTGKQRFSSHTIDIQGLSGECWLYGIQTFNLKTGGILLNVINEGGTLARQWAKNMNYVQPFLDAIGVNQLHIWLGTNDAGAEWRTADQFETDYNTMLNQINLAVDRDILLYTFTQRESFNTAGIEDTAFTNLISQYVSKVKKVGKERGYSVFDLYSVYPKFTDAKALGMYVDQIHPSTKGASYTISLLLPYIVPDIARNYANLDNNNYFKRAIGIQQGQYIGAAFVNSAGQTVYPTDTGLKFTTTDIQYYLSGVRKIRYGSGMGFEITQNVAGEVILRVKNTNGNNLDFKYDSTLGSFILDTAGTGLVVSKDGVNTFQASNSSFELFKTLIMRSADGSRWTVQVNNDGTISTTKL